MPDKPMILMIDDDPFAIATLQALLQADHYKFLVAQNGEEGLEKARAFHPDLILLDIMMPGMDGFSLCERIRKEKDISESTIVMITALDDKESKIKGFEAGADDYITKPFDKVELKLRIQTILKLNRFRKLFNERERFKSIFDDFPRAIFLIDSHGVIKETNCKANEIFHYAPLIGNEMKNLLHPAFQEHFQQTLSHLDTVNNRANIPVLFSLPSQEPFATDIFLLRLMIQESPYFQVLIKNEATNPFSESVDRSISQHFQEMTNSIALIDQDYNILWANPSMLAFLGHAQSEKAIHALHEWFQLDRQRTVDESHQDFTIRLVPLTPKMQSQLPDQECLFYIMHLMVPGKPIYMLSIVPTGERFQVERWESQIYKSLSVYMERSRTQVHSILRSMQNITPHGQLFKNYWESYHAAVTPLVSFLYMTTRFNDKSQVLPDCTPEPFSLAEMMTEIDKEISHDPEWRYPVLSLELTPVPMVQTDRKIFKSLLRSWLYFLPQSLVNQSITVTAHQTETFACLDIRYDPTQRRNPNWNQFWNRLFSRKSSHTAHPEDAFYLLNFKKLIPHLGGEMQIRTEPHPHCQHLIFCFPILASPSIEK